MCSKILKESLTSYSPRSRVDAHLQRHTTSKTIFNVRSVCRSISAFLTRSVLVFVRAQSGNEAALFESQVPTMIALTKNCKFVKVVRELEDVPAGCGSAVISPTVVMHILVRVCILRCDIQCVG